MTAALLESYKTSSDALPSQAATVYPGNGVNFGFPGGHQVMNSFRLWDSSSTQQVSVQKHYVEACNGRYDRAAAMSRLHEARDVSSTGDVQQQAAVDGIPGCVVIKRELNPFCTESVTNLPSCRYAVCNANP